MNIITDIPPLIINALLRILAAIIVVLLSIWLARLCRRWSNRVLQQTTLTESIIILINFFVYYGIIVLMIFFALSILGVPTTTLVASSSAILVVLGLALRQTISDFAATVVIMLFQPFKVGDTIETYGKTGVVKELQFFNTILLTGDNKQVSLPNSKVQESGIVNYSRVGTLRADLVFNINYLEDAARVKKILEDIIKSDGRILAEPAPEVIVQDVSASGITLVARPFMKFADYGQVQVDLRERIRRRFQEENVDLPHAQYDVHLFQVASS